MNSPYGAPRLVNRTIETEAERRDAVRRAQSLPRIVVADRFLADAEMLATGAFTPLCGFMTRAEVESVVARAALPNGLPWGVPIVLPVPDGGAVDVGAAVSLADAGGRSVAILQVTERYDFPVDRYCAGVFATNDPGHPGVAVMTACGGAFLAGPVALVARPARNGIDSRTVLDPAQTREEFARRGWSTIAAFQTRNPIHRAHEYVIKCALETMDGVLIHPLIGDTKPDDVPADVRMRCYEVVLAGYFNRSRVVLSGLPAWMRYGGPREALNHAIVRRNYGCTHLIVGRDHAGVGAYYGPSDAQDLLGSLAPDLGMHILAFADVFFCRTCGCTATAKTCPHPASRHVTVSGTEFREMLRRGVPPPTEIARREIVEILAAWQNGRSATNHLNGDSR